MKRKLKYIGKIEDNQASKDALEIVREYNKSIGSEKQLQKLIDCQVKKFTNNPKAFTACTMYLDISYFDVEGYKKVKIYFGLVELFPEIQKQLGIPIPEKTERKFIDSVDLPLEAFVYRDSEGRDEYGRRRGEYPPYIDRLFHR